VTDSEPPKNPAGNAGKRELIRANADLRAFFVASGILPDSDGGIPAAYFPKILRGIMRRYAVLCALCAFLRLFRFGAIPQSLRISKMRLYPPIHAVSSPLSASAGRGGRCFVPLRPQPGGAGTFGYAIRDTHYAVTPGFARLCQRARAQPLIKRLRTAGKGPVLHSRLVHKSRRGGGGVGGIPALDGSFLATSPP
jgi:hypothetical protein